ncbi:MAG: ribose 5-phosphate isomerase B [Proteobacteria bacterium]|jgi:RpiB/LacA/LacB family sugar-phosphate isomerase|nr:ribose 5-phosphate isomerase B [Pseudomonadota bacterium]
MKKTIWIGSDHAGLDLKSAIKNELSSQYDVKDVGPNDTTSVDYPDFGEKVALEVAKDGSSEGILICGSGIGMSIAANKVAGVRAALVHSIETATLSKQHNNANVLCLGARTTDNKLALQMVRAWLDAKFEGDRHQRRVDKLSNLDKKRS